MKSTHKTPAGCLTVGLSSAAIVLTLMSAATMSRAILVQPLNYLLDDHAMVNAHDSGSLSPFYNDQSGTSEHGADKDIVSIIGDSLAKLRFARMLDNQQSNLQNNNEQDDGSSNVHHLSQEMAELIQNEQQNGAKQEAANSQDQSLSSSVANMLLNVAQAAAASQSASEDRDQEQAGTNGDASMGPRGGSIMELDTSQSSSGSMPSKADLKVGTSQWFNPKETIPVLKISSMATPSKYKKVYFRSEKKLVDGAFHSPSGDVSEKKSLVKSFNSGVQRRSSRGSHASAPPTVLQDGVIDFLRKFRDVYVQTRPAGSNSGSNLASSMVSAAASSPFAAILAPSSSGSRPNLASAFSAASSVVNGAAMLSQAANSPAGSSSQLSTASGNAVTGAGATAGANPNKSPLTAQSYVSFWSKTFPTWVRKMLKQMRRRSLYNSSKRQQHQHHNQHNIAGLGQKIASNAIANVVESASNSGSSSSGSGTNNGSNSASA